MCSSLTPRPTLTFSTRRLGLPAMKRSGKFLDLGEFRAQAAQAQRLPNFRAKFENLRLNRRIDANVQFISDADWMQCAGPLDHEGTGWQAMLCGPGSVDDHRHERAVPILAAQRQPCCLFSGCRPKACLIATARRAGHYRTWRDAGFAGDDARQGNQLQGHHPSGWLRSTTEYRFEGGRL